MSYRCAHCKGRHAKLDTVRQCAAEAEEERQKRAAEIRAQGRMSQLPAYVRASEDAGIVQASDRGNKKLPAGFYWSGGEHGFLIIEVRVPKYGRWKGRYFINTSFDGCPWECCFRKHERESLIDVLLSQDWGSMMLDYGIRTGLCPVCNQKLDKTSGEATVGVHGLSGPFGDSCAKVVVGKE